jgi:hypothetical protein
MGREGCTGFQARVGIFCSFLVKFPEAPQNVSCRTTRAIGSIPSFKSSYALTCMPFEQVWCLPATVQPEGAISTLAADDARRTDGDTLRSLRHC